MMTIRPKAFDMTQVKLSAQEGFVLSRVVGTVTVGDLVDLSGLDEATVTAIVRRLADEGTVEVEPPFGARLTACGMTDVGVARSNNEDAFRVVDLGASGMLLVVCDGMGGENAGEVASALAVDEICSHMAAAAADEDAAASLRGAVEHANDVVVAAARAPGRKGMGTTVVAALIRDGDAITAEVGDSRAYVLRGGRLTQLSKDQTYVQLLLEQGLLAPDAVKSSVAKNVVLQAIGKAPELLVAQRRLSLRSGDQLLLCSDGLSSYVKDDEIEDVLTSRTSLDEACTALIALANERGGHDNVTVITALVGAQRRAAPDETIEETLTTIRPYAVGAPSDDQHAAD